MVKKHSKEVREIIKITSTGRKQSDETKEKKGKKLKGIKRSAEVCANISKGRTGIKYSDEGKRKLKESRKSGENHFNTNYIEIYNESDELMFVCNKDFNSFCKENNLPSSAFKSSYQTGSLLYLTNNKSALTKLEKSGNIKYKGWRAVNKGKCVEVIKSII